MLVEIPDELLSELEKTYAKMRRLSNRSGSEAYWGAVGDHEVATYPILDIIHDAAQGKLPKHSCKTAKVKK